MPIYNVDTSQALYTCSHTHKNKNMVQPRLNVTALKYK